jgi:dienelactone hydrolase
MRTVGRLTRKCIRQRSTAGCHRGPPFVFEVMLAAALLSSVAGAREERLALRLTSGTEVQVRLQRASDDSVRLPAIVVVGGLERGAAVVDLIPRTTEAVLVGFDYPFAMPERVTWTELLPLARRIEKGIGETIETLGRLHALLARRADIDSDRLTIVGVSLGAPFAVVTAARQDWRGVVIIDGFGDLPRTVRYQFARRWRTRYGLVGEVLAWLAQTAAMQLIDVPEPEAAARSLRADQHVYMIDARDDEFVPERSRESLREALRQSEAQLTFETMPGRHIRASEGQTIAQLYEEARAWMQRVGLLASRKPDDR